MRLRRRFVDHLASLPDADWNRQSRCSEWTIHEVARHVRDAALVHVEHLSGRGRLFKGEPFDPRKTPSLWLASSSAASPDQTLVDLNRVLGQEETLLARRGDNPEGRLWRGPAGRMVHPSTFSLHIFWDAWIHERDIALPLGLQMPQSDLETQMAVLYALLIAATPARLAGDTVETAVRLDGSPSQVYDIGYTDAGVIVEASSGKDAPLRSDMAPMLDSLMGRGPELHAVAEGPDDVIKKFSLLRSMAT